MIVEKVSKYFREDQVLKEVSFRLERGKIHGIIGNNGSGKTVLFKCICGFLLSDSGQIFVNGKQIGKEVDFPENTGMIIENPGFLPRLSGKENLRLLASLNKRIGDREIDSAMERVGLDPGLKKRVGSYSLGMRQRLGIAQAIMEDPKLLILDEPFNGLDKKMAAEIRSLLEEFRHRGGTVLLTSHNAGDIERLCDTVYEMECGVCSVYEGV